MPRRSSLTSLTFHTQATETPSRRRRYGLQETFQYPRACSPVDSRWRVCCSCAWSLFSARSILTLVAHAPSHSHRPQNVIGQAQSGTGKTAAFSLGMLGLVNPDLHYPQALCLAPARELAIQICDVVKRLARFTDIDIALAVPQAPRTLRPNSTHARTQPREIERERERDRERDSYKAALPFACSSRCHQVSSDHRHSRCRESVVFKEGCQAGQDQSLSSTHSTLVLVLVLLLLLCLAHADCFARVSACVASFASLCSTRPTTWWCRSSNFVRT